MYGENDWVQVYSMTDEGSIPATKSDVDTESTTEQSKKIKNTFIFKQEMDLIKKILHNAQINEKQRWQSK